jgi:hypothetical protein
MDLLVMGQKTKTVGKRGTATSNIPEEDERSRDRKE